MVSDLKIKQWQPSPAVRAAGDGDLPEG